MNILLYITVIAIWGSTWLAISVQSGTAPVLTSIFYRFLLAATVLVTITICRRSFKWLRGRDLLFTILQGLCLYSINFICIYNGVKYISGGMESLIFSMAVLFNFAGSKLFRKEPVPKRFKFSAVVGMMGLILILLQDLSLQTQDSWKGILLCLIGTLLFSLGNMIGKRQFHAGLSVMQTNCYAMIWGTVLVAMVMIFTKTTFTIPHQASFLFPLFYLAIPGSVIAFTAYLTLVNRIGPQKASFITIMTPLIALFLAVLFEGEPLSIIKVCGVLLILLGNWYININRRKKSISV